LNGARSEAALADKLLGPGPRIDNLFSAIAIKAGDYDEADKRARHAIASTRDPRVLARSYDHLQTVYYQRRDYGGVEQVYLEIERLEPTSAWARGNYASFLVRRGELDRAITTAQQALAMMSYGAAHRTLAEAYAERGAQSLWERGLAEAAKDDFERAVHADPTYANAHYGLGAYWRLVAAPGGDKAALDRSSEELRAAATLDKESSLATKALTENTKQSASP
jgi:Tfp pilus assembly protein PilF